MTSNHERREGSRAQRAARHGGVDAGPDDPVVGAREMKILMLHGINHGMFGKRDPKQYGTVTLAEIDARLQALGGELGAKVISFQSDHEGAFCERIHQSLRRRYRCGTDQCRRVDALQLRHPRRAGDPDGANRRTTHVQHPRPRALPAPHFRCSPRSCAGRDLRFGVDSYLLRCAPQLQQCQRSSRPSRRWPMCSRRTRCHPASADRVLHRWRRGPRKSVAEGSRRLFGLPDHTVGHATAMNRLRSLLKRRQQLQRESSLAGTPAV